MPRFGSCAGPSVETPCQPGKPRFLGHGYASRVIIRWNLGTSQEPLGDRFLRPASGVPKTVGRVEKVRSLLGLDGSILASNGWPIVDSWIGYSSVGGKLPASNKVP